LFLLSLRCRYLVFIKYRRLFKNTKNQEKTCFKWYWWQSNGDANWYVGRIRTYYQTFVCRTINKNINDKPRKN